MLGLFVNKPRPGQVLFLGACCLCYHLSSTLLGDIMFNATVFYAGDYQDLQCQLDLSLPHLGQYLAGRHHDQGHYLTT